VELLDEPRAADPEQVLQVHDQRVELAHGDSEPRARRLRRQIDLDAVRHAGELGDRVGVVQRSDEAAPPLRRQVLPADRQRRAEAEDDGDLVLRDLAPDHRSAAALDVADVSVHGTRQRGVRRPTGHLPRPNSDSWRLNVERGCMT